MREGSPEHAPEIALSRPIATRYPKMQANGDRIAGYSNLLSRNPF
jgi:hypothetical protein